MTTEKLPPDILVVTGCPACKKPMRRIDGKKGPFYGCSGYPDCKTTVNEDVAIKAAYEKGWHKAVEKFRQAAPGGTKP